MTLVLAKTRDDIRLWCHGRVALLGHRRTQELVHLEVPQGQDSDEVWDIAADANDHALLLRQGADTAEWAQNRLELRVYECDQTSVVVDKDHVLESLGVFLARHQLATVGIKLGINRSEVRLAVAWFTKRPCGAWMWWSLTDLFTTAGLEYKELSPAEWVNKHLNKWMAWLGTQGIGAEHIRRSMAYNRVEGAQPDHARVLHWSSVSSVGLVVLCGRWASKQPANGGISALNQPKVAEFLKAMLERVNWVNGDGTWDFDLFLGDWSLMAPFPPRSAIMV